MSDSHDSDKSTARKRGVDEIDGAEVYGSAIRVKIASSDEPQPTNDNELEDAEDSDFVTFYEDQEDYEADASRDSDGEMSAGISESSDDNEPTTDSGPTKGQEKEMLYEYAEELLKKEWEMNEGADADSDEEYTPTRDEVKEKLLQLYHRPDEFGT